MLRKRAAFSIARSPPIPTMSRRSLDRRAADALAGAYFFATDPLAAFAAAEAKLTKALSSVPDHARAPFVIGILSTYGPSARRRASPNVNMRWRWIEISPTPMPLSDYGKIFIGRAEETEAHIGEALRLSPRDTMAYIWMTIRGPGEDPTSAVRSRRSRGFDGRSRPTEIFRMRILQLAAALAQLGRLDEARSAVKAGLALNPTFTISRARAFWTAVATTRRIWPRLEPIFEGLRKAGVPEQ